MHATHPRRNILLRTVMDKESSLLGLIISNCYKNNNSRQFIIHSFPSFPSPPASRVIPSITVGVRASFTPPPSPS